MKRIRQYRKNFETLRTTAVMSDVERFLMDKKVPKVVYLCIAQIRSSSCSDATSCYEKGAVLHASEFQTHMLCGIPNNYPSQIACTKHIGIRKTSAELSPGAVRRIAC